MAVFLSACVGAFLPPTWKGTEGREHGDGNAVKVPGILTGLVEISKGIVSGFPRV